MCVFTCFLHMWLVSAGRRRAPKVNFYGQHQSPLLSFPGSLHLLPSPRHVRLANHSAFIFVISFLISPFFLGFISTFYQPKFAVFSLQRTRQVSVFQVGPGGFLRAFVAPRGASCSRQILVRLSASHLCLNETHAFMKGRTFSAGTGGH